MSKQKKNKKKLKGVRYIAKVLQKYGGKKYKGNYKAALQKSREVITQIKSKGQKVKVLTILDVTRKHRIKEEPQEQKAQKAPNLFYKLSQPQEYFTLVDYPTYIHDTSNEVTFISDIFNAEVEEIEGGQRPSFRKTFSGFVNYLNKIITDRTLSYDYRVMCLPPEYNKELKRWESKIVSIDPDGEENTFGYEPEISPSGEGIERRKKEKAPPREIKAPKSDFQVQKEFELKIEQEKSRQLAMQLFSSGKITKLEYKTLIDEINKNK